MKYSIAIVLLFLSACGGGSSSDPVSAPAQPASVPAAAAPTPTPAATPVSTPTPVNAPAAPVVTAPPAMPAPAPVVPVIDPPPPNQDIGGIWTTVVSVPSPDGTPPYPAYNATLTMLTTEAGQAYYLYPAGLTVPTEPPGYSRSFLYPDDEYIGALSVAGSAVTGTVDEGLDGLYTAADGNAYLGPTGWVIVDPLDCFDVYCPVNTAAVPVSGTVTHGATLVLNGVTWTYSGLYNDPSSLAAVAGSWTGELDGTLDGPASTTLTIDSTGALTEQDPGTDCVLSGQISPIDPSYNAYSVTWTYSGSDCLAGLQSATGIAYIDYSVEPVVLHVMTETAPADDIVALTEVPAMQ